MLEGQRVVVGVERGLVPLVGEALGELVRRMPLVLLAGIRVAAEVVVVMPALEVLVDLDHPVHFVTHVGPQDLGRDPGVVRDAHRLPDVVAEAGDDDLVVGAGTLRPRRGLQAMRQLVDGEPVGDLRERPQHAEHTLGDTVLVLERLFADHRPLLGRRLVHAAEARLWLCLLRLRHVAIVP